MRWLLNRLSERSTWLSLGTLVSAVAGVSFMPVHAVDILMAASGVLASIGVVTKEA